MYVTEEEWDKEYFPGHKRAALQGVIEGCNPIDSRGVQYERVYSSFYTLTCHQKTDTIHAILKVGARSILATTARGKIRDEMFRNLADLSLYHQSTFAKTHPQWLVAALREREERREAERAARRVARALFPWALRPGGAVERVCARRFRASVS